jgi:hypothetical protein
MGEEPGAEAFGFPWDLTTELAEPARRTSVEEVEERRKRVRCEAGDEWV